jgi:hypothetical protein
MSSKIKKHQVRKPKNYRIKQSFIIDRSDPREYNNKRDKDSKNWKKEDWID